MMQRHTIQVKFINKRQLLLGVMALSSGSLIYIIDRPPCNTYFVKLLNISFFNLLPNLFGPAAYYLPAFLHVFAFILITASLLPSRKIYYFIITSGWFLIDCIFELGQKYKDYSSIIPSWFSKIPFLENAKTYFQYGTFDSLDMFAISIGSVVAYFALLMTVERR